MLAQRGEHVGSVVDSGVVLPFGGLGLAGLGGVEVDHGQSGGSAGHADVVGAGCPAPGDAAGVGGGEDGVAGRGGVGVAGENLAGILRGSCKWICGCGIGGGGVGWGDACGFVGGFGFDGEDSADDEEKEERAGDGDDDVLQFQVRVLSELKRIVAMAVRLNNIGVLNWVHVLAFVNLVPFGPIRPQSPRGGVGKSFAASK